MGCIRYKTGILVLIVDDAAVAKKNFVPVTHAVPGYCPIWSLRHEHLFCLFGGFHPSNIYGYIPGAGAESVECGPRVWEMGRSVPGSSQASDKRIY